MGSLPFNFHLDASAGVKSEFETKEASNPATPPSVQSPVTPFFQTPTSQPVTPVNRQHPAELPATPTSASAKPDETQMLRIQLGIAQAELQAARLRLLMHHIDPTQGSRTDGTEEVPCVIE